MGPSSVCDQQTSAPDTRQRSALFLEAVCRRLKSSFFLKHSLGEGEKQDFRETLDPTLRFTASPCKLLTLDFGRVT